MAIDKKTTARDIDWESIAIQYRAGIKSLKLIGKEFGVSDAGILKRAKRLGWERDLGAKIRAKAAAKVSAAAVSEEVSSQTSANEREVVEANSELQKNIILGHRTDIKKNRVLVSSLFDELESMTGDKKVFENLAASLLSEDGKVSDTAMKAFWRAIDHPTRVDSAKKLTETLKNLIAMERQAFGIDETNQSPGETLEDFLIKVGKKENVGVS